MRASTIRCRTRTPRRSGPSCSTGWCWRRIFITVAVYRLYLSQLLTIRWRRWLSEVYFRDWLTDRTYYRLEIINPGGTDNPEQRIEQDCATVCHADAQPDRQPAAADHDADHVRDRAVGAVGQLPAADLRRHRHPRLHDVGGDPLRAAGLVADLPDRPAAGAGQLRAGALQRRLPLPHDAHPRERREHRALSRRGGRGATPARARSGASIRPGSTS